MMESSHDTFVEAWLVERARGASSRAVASLFRRALGTIWQRAATSLGAITVGAIFHRVLQTARRTHLALEHVRVTGASVPIELDEDAVAGTGDVGSLSAASRDVLAELLHVFGRLTDEALTPGLRAAMNDVSIRTPPEGRAATNHGVHE